jgi:CheY-like chemotaxis protein
MSTILLAEDNPDDVWIMRRALKTAGVTEALQVVENGREAIDYLAGKGKYANRDEFPLPCILLLDIKMPYLSGLDVIKWVRTESEMKTLLSIFLTSSKDGRDIHEAYALGANAYLVKPPEIARLTEMLRSMKDFLLVHNQPPPEVPQCRPG